MLDSSVKYTYTKYPITAATVTPVPTAATAPTVIPTIAPVERSSSLLFPWAPGTNVGVISAI